MAFSIKKQIATLAVSALALAPVATGVTLLTAEPAFAKPNGNGGGGRENSRRDRSDRDNGNRGASRSGNNRSSNNGNARSTHAQTPQTATVQPVAAPTNGNAYGQSTADEDRPGQGAIRSELKGMNAIHSFKDGAFPNAASGSQVGRLATYFESAGITSVAFEDYAAARGAVEEFNTANPEFVPDLAGAQTGLQDALMAFDAKYSPEGESLEIDSLEDAYTYVDAAYGTADDADDPIDTPEELQAVIDTLDPADASDAEQIAALQTLKSELETLEGLDQELTRQEDYAVLAETLTVEQCGYQSALDEEGLAFVEASNGREPSEFSDATITYLRDTLGLGEAYTYPESPADCSAT